jgi:pyrroloquinoline quinone (PQQ) biosynthesis protein C
VLVVVLRSKRAHGHSYALIRSNSLIDLRECLLVFNDRARIGIRVVEELSMQSVAVNPPIVAPSSAAHYVASLEAEARAHRAVRHPYLKALAEGLLPDCSAAVRDLTHQYLAYSSNFPRYLTSTISRLERAHHREVLLQNLAEEAGQLDEDELPLLAAAGIAHEWVEGVAHPRLYRRFLEALGMNDAYLGSHPYCDEAIVWSQLFLHCCQESAAKAVGALGLGTELIVREVYRPVLDAIIRYTAVSPSDRVFFDLHCCVDDAHGRSLVAIAVDLAEDPTQRRDIRLGMLMALNLRAFFYDHMMLRAQAPKEEF